MRVAAGAVVVMGVSGCGKTTLGRALAAALGWRFVEGDTLHPEANIAKMTAGHPLDDADRRPFLENVAAALHAGQAAGIVVSCSALRRSYRDLIRARVTAVRLVLPVLERAQIAARLAQRHDHFMPPALLASQFEAFEPPGAQERVILVDGTADTAVQVAQARAALPQAGQPDHLERSPGL
ncbi:MAG: AAA family ATPase [Gammaproteobacteria bacterium]|nr:AAA family ATPase [Gammaproteobacteria bacterium]